MKSIFLLFFVGLVVLVGFSAYADVNDNLIQTEYSVSTLHSDFIDICIDNVCNQSCFFYRQIELSIYHSIEVKLKLDYLSFENKQVSFLNNKNQFQYNFYKYESDKSNQLNNKPFSLLCFNGFYPKFLIHNSMSLS